MNFRRVGLVDLYDRVVRKSRASSEFRSVSIELFILLLKAVVIITRVYTVLFFVILNVVNMGQRWFIFIF